MSELLTHPIFRGIVTLISERKTLLMPLLIKHMAHIRFVCSNNFDFNFTPVGIPLFSNEFDQQLGFLNSINQSKI